MKTNYLNVAIGLAVVLAVLYYIKPSMFTSEGFEGNVDTSAGGIIGLVFASILGIGILLAFIGGFSEVGRR